MALPTPTNSQVLIKGWAEAGTCRRGWKHLFLWVWGVVQVGGTCEQRQVGRWGPEAGGQSPGPPSHQVPPTTAPRLIPTVGRGSMQVGVGWLTSPSVPSRPRGLKPSWETVGA